VTLKHEVSKKFYSVCQGSGFKSVCQRDPRSKAGKEGREGRGTGLGLVGNIRQKDNVLSQRGQGI